MILMPDKIYFIVFVLSFVIWIGTVLYAISKKKPIPMIVMSAIMNATVLVRIAFKIIW